MTYTAAQLVDVVTNVTIPLVVRWSLVTAVCWYVVKVVFYEALVWGCRRFRKRIYCEHCRAIEVQTGEPL
jgi:uncharacterized membrane protein